MVGLCNSHPFASPADSDFKWLFPVPASRLFVTSCLVLGSQVLGSLLLAALTSLPSRSAACVCSMRLFLAMPLQTYRDLIDTWRCEERNGQDQCFCYKSSWRSESDNDDQVLLHMTGQDAIVALIYKTARTSRRFGTSLSCSVPGTQTDEMLPASSLKRKHIDKQLVETDLGLPFAYDIKAGYVLLRYEVDIAHIEAARSMLLVLCLVHGEGCLCLVMFVA